MVSFMANRAPDSNFELLPPQLLMRAKAARLPYYGSDAPSYGGFSSPSYFFDD